MTKYKMPQDYSIIDQWNNDLHKELEDHLAKQLQEEIDWEIMCELMKTVGWTQVKMTWDGYMTDSDAHKIKEWCKENLQGNYNARGNTWVFEKEKDATMFILRWS